MATKYDEDVEDSTSHDEPEISVIIPSLDEVANLVEIIPRIADHHEIVVVEGSDFDATKQAVLEVRPDARVIGQTRKGKGNALLCGVEEATGRYLVMLDADGSADPDEIEDFVDALRNGAEMAKGTRYRSGGGSEDLTVLRSGGNLGLTLLFNVLFRRWFTDLCYGYNVFDSRTFDRLGLPDTDPQSGDQWGDGFEIETLFACRAVTAGLNIKEVPSYEFDRIHGSSNLDAWDDGKRVLVTLVREWASDIRQKFSGKAAPARK